MEVKISHKNFTIKFEINSEYPISCYENYDDFYKFMPPNKIKFISNYLDDIIAHIEKCKHGSVESMFLTPLALACINMPPKKHLYFFKNDLGLIKIGISNDPDKRKKALEKRLRCKIEIIKVLELCEDYERILHKKFEANNVPFKGQTEWFFADNKLISFISGVTEKNISDIWLTR